MLKKILLVFVIVTLCLASGYFAGKAVQNDQNRASEREILGSLLLKNVVELSTTQLAISKVFEVNREGLSIGSLDVPFTKQDLLVAAEGSAVLGVDMAEASIKKTAHAWIVQVGPPKILHQDVNFKFLSESDTILNRIQPQDRNEIMQKLKLRVRQETELWMKDHPIVEDRLKEISSRLSTMLELDLVIYPKNDNQNQL